MSRKERKKPIPTLPKIWLFVPFILELRNYDMPNCDGAGKNFKRDATCFFSRAAVEFFSSIFTTLFGSVRSTILSGTFTALQSFEGGDEIELLHEKEVLETCRQSTEMPQIAKLQNFGETSLKIEKVHKNEDFTFSTSSENYDQFTRFDMVSDCPDHHFLSSGKGSMLSQLVHYISGGLLVNPNLYESGKVDLFESAKHLDRHRLSSVESREIYYTSSSFFLSGSRA